MMKTTGALVCIAVGLLGLGSSRAAAAAETESPVVTTAGSRRVAPLPHATKAPPNGAATKETESDERSLTVGSVSAQPTKTSAKGDSNPHPGSASVRQTEALLASDAKPPVSFAPAKTSRLLRLHSSRKRKLWVSRRRPTLVASSLLRALPQE